MVSYLFLLDLLLSLSFDLKIIFQTRDQTMVFGSKPSEDILQKPAPPNIDQILEDLNNADRQDSIFTLNPEEVFKEDSSSEASKVYEEVTAFVSKEKQISLLQAWIYKMSFAVRGGWWRVKLFWRILGDIREN